MKRIVFIAMTAAAVLCGCQKENLLPQEVNEGQALVFTATTEGVPAPIENAPASKATLDSENTPEWEVGDVISIDGHAYTATTAGKNSTFEGSGATEGTHHAYFPANLYISSTTAALPAIQTYTEGKFDMPMYAESTTTELSFKNLCAVLAIKVTSDDIATLKSIKVASDKKMNGSFTITENAAVIGEDGTNVVVLESAEALTLDETGTTFYIYIPAQEYKYLNIFLSADGETYTQAMATKKAAGLGAIARNTIFNIDYKKNATKLWESKLFFADCNIGASSPSEYGGYYTWGGTYANGKDIPWVDDHDSHWNRSLSGDSDTATKLWGSNWCMPTEDELWALLENCNVEWTAVNGVNGDKYTGKGDYASNIVFLPAAGYCDEGVYSQGFSGAYWSSTPIGSELAYYLGFIEYGQHVYFDGGRNFGNSVRAVLVEQ